MHLSGIEKVDCQIDQSPAKAFDAGDVIAAALRLLRCIHAFGPSVGTGDLSEGLCWLLSVEKITMNNGMTRRPGFAVPDSLASASRDLNDLFDRLFDAPLRVSGSQAWFAPTSVWEDDGNFTVELDLPGIAPDDLDVTVDDGKLTVTAKRTDAEDRKYLHQERRFGELTRSITLPESVDPESIEAEYVHGVLRVTLTKRPEVQPRKIEIKVG